MNWKKGQKKPLRMKHRYKGMKNIKGGVGDIKDTLRKSDTPLFGAQEGGK